LTIDDNRCLSKFCDIIDVCSFRILNSVFRGHVMANGERLSEALKIIMHSNYLHTRDHPQRTHQNLDLDLDEIDYADAPPADPDRGTGFVFSDFSVGDKVQVWHHRDWWHGKVAYKSRAETLSVRMIGDSAALSGILPKHTKPAVE
jgi:hypothetical protein